MFCQCLMPVSYTHLDVYKRQGEYRWILITLMHDTDDAVCKGQITVTYRDVSHRYKYYDIIEKKNLELKKLLQTAEQYKAALMSEAIVLYQVNFSKDIIENDIIQRKKNSALKVLNAVGINTPCSYDEYCRRWHKRVSDDTINNYMLLETSAKMIDEYNKGKTLLTQDYRTLDTQNEEMWVSKTVYLAKDNICLLYTSDNFKRKRFIRNRVCKTCRRGV